MSNQHGSCNQSVGRKIDFYHLRIFNVASNFLRLT